jgi:hypothetical protein
MRPFDADTMTPEETRAFEQECEHNANAGRFIFTPRLGDEDGSRVLMWISYEDDRKLTRGPGPKGTVTDLDTGSVFAVFGAPCAKGADGVGCYCDAVARLLAPEN